MEMVTEAEEIIMKELRSLLMKDVVNLVVGVILLLPLLFSPALHFLPLSLLSAADIDMLDNHSFFCEEWHHG